MIRFSPKLETLDDRIVPSCTWVESDGVLTITGSQRANVVDIVDDGTTLTITCDGENVDVSADVTSIVLRMANGNDRVSYSLTGDLAAGTARSLEVWLGNGNDGFVGDISGNLLDGSSLDLAVRGWNGNDRLRLAAEGDVGTDASLSVFLSGSNGKDEVTSSYSGVLLGVLNWDVMGCNGKDLLTNDITFGAGSTGTADVEVLGHNAPDTIHLMVMDNSGDDGDPLTDDASTLGEHSFVVNGGRSHDRIEASDNVDVLDAAHA